MFSKVDTHATNTLSLSWVHKINEFEWTSLLYCCCYSGLKHANHALINFPSRIKHKRRHDQLRKLSVTLVKLHLWLLWHRTTNWWNVEDRWWWSCCVKYINHIQHIWCCCLSLEPQCHRNIAIVRRNSQKNITYSSLQIKTKTELSIIVQTAGIHSCLMPRSQVRLLAPVDRSVLGTQRYPPTQIYPQVVGYLLMPWECTWELVLH